MNRTINIIMTAALLFSCGTPRLQEDNIDDIIDHLTIDEKVRLLVGTCKDPANPPYPAPGTMTERRYWQSDGENTYKAANRVQGSAGESYKVDRLGIPSLVYADGPAGLRIDPLRESEPGKEYYCTAFPSATVIASSWNPKLAEDVGKAMGNEVLEYGVDILLAPGMNIKRNPLTGRNFEYYSEDPLLSGEIAAAVVNGIQSQGVGACIKHFAVNNQETFRNGINAIVSEQALREIYLRGFEIAVRKSFPWTVMSSYNKINGEYASESRRLLTDILRDEWGFEGYVMTDWWGADDPVAQMKAGNNLLMPGTPVQIEEIVNAVNNGCLDIDIINTNLTEILSIVTKSPSFKRYRYSNSPDLVLHAEVSKAAASEGMVLLKNDGTLPLDKNKSIALFGNFSYDTQAGGSGSGYVHRKYTVEIADGLDNAGFEINKVIADRYREHIAEEKSHMPEENFWSIPIAMERDVRHDEIEQAAEDDDVAIITLGRMSGEGSDRFYGKGDYLLSDLEYDLVESVCSSFHRNGKKVIVILNMGDAIDFSRWNSMPDAILMAWLPGQEAGDAIAEILDGRVNPSGKLPMTMAARYEDIPSSRNFGISEGETNAVRYEEGLMVGYRYFATAGIKPCYPFGFGMSYTQFEYSDLSYTTDENRNIRMNFKITNTGKVSGKEIAQVYVNKPEIATVRPAIELCAFHKTAELAPGESELISINITSDAIRQWDPESGRWKCPESGYRIFVGASSEDIRLSGSL